MGLTDSLSIGALAVSTGSAVLAGLAWSTSRRSANATERQATAAEQQTELLRQQMEVERSHQLTETSSRGTDDAAQARLVFLELSGMGGLAVNITNHSDASVAHVKLDDVQADDHPTLTWRFNPRVFGAKQVKEALSPGASVKFYVEFTDEAGDPVRFPRDAYTIKYSFTDASGQRWRRVGNAEPEKVE